MPNWTYGCGPDIFEELKDRQDFQSVLTLARVVNSLQFVLTAMNHDPQDQSPTARRSRINSYLFGSAILYEGLLLVEGMNQIFGANDAYKKGLKALLGDRVALRLRKNHMKDARNKAVFHFDVAAFGDLVRRGGVPYCEFMTGISQNPADSYYPFADIIAAEITMNEIGATENYYDRMGELIAGTNDLAMRFINSAHKLILPCLREWKFAQETSVSADPLGIK